MGWSVVIAYGWCLFLYLSVQFIELVYLNLNCVPVNESCRWRGETLITKMCVITIHWMRTKEGKKKINHVSVKRKATLTQRVQKAMLDLDQYVDFSKSHAVH